MPVPGMRWLCLNDESAGAIETKTHTILSSSAHSKHSKMFDVFINTRRSDNSSNDVVDRDGRFEVAIVFISKPSLSRAEPTAAYCNTCIHV